MATIQIKTTAGEAVTLPDGVDVENADFEQFGLDLILTTEDGTVVVLHDYFSHRTLPNINLASGDVMTGAIVANLAQVDIIQPLPNIPGAPSGNAPTDPQNDDLSGFETASESNSGPQENTFEVQDDPEQDPEQDNSGGFETASGEDDEVPPSSPDSLSFDNTPDQDLETDTQASGPELPTTPQPIFRGPAQSQGFEPETTSTNSTTPNRAPTVENQSVNLHETNTLEGQLSASDPDGDVLNYGLRPNGEPENGTVSLNSDGSYSYVPNAGFIGNDSFQFRVGDGQGGVGTGRIVITVLDDPDAEDSTQTVNENEVLVGDLRGDITDQDSGTHNFELVDGTDNGTIILNADGTYTFTPNTDFDGPDSFSYRVTDATGGTDTATVDISVANVVAASDTGGTTSGTDGDDAVTGGTGNDRLLGGDGNDQLAGGEGNDTLYGGEGDDEIDGGSGNDNLYGGTDDDELSGGEGADRLYGQTGEDILNGDEGADRLYGGDDNDTVNGGTDNDSLYGDAGDDIINGGEGADRIYGGAGADTLDGGTGNDSLYIDGDDTFTGGEGVDRAYVLTDDDMNIDLATSEIEYVKSNEGDDVLDASSSSANTSIYGQGGADNIDGGSGIDRLYGGNDNDDIDGGAGNDSLYGDAGDDTVNGGEGNDRIYGGDGADTLNGGGGAEG
ncbi:MAG: tandem-95 repeat protein, partial [Rhodospirillaceae bacterium]|nr:tandem-95 repeat protein [Rhodospirillaceae bacterium]